MIITLWESWSAATQDRLLMLVFLLPILLLGLLLVSGFRPFALIAALLWRHRWTHLVFIVVIAISVGLAAGLSAQERALRKGTAEAAAGFDLVVTAPGSEVSMMLATVYLQPTSAPLLPYAVLESLLGNDSIAFAAPLAFGDNHRGSPIVGTVADLVEHLSPQLAAGRMFEMPMEAVVGAQSTLAVGDQFNAQHGSILGESHSVHGGEPFTIVGRIQATGSPWDKALIVPIEALWLLHGLGDGHGPQITPSIGAPFDATRFPGTTAIVVHANNLAGTYALQAEFSRSDTMAFFPGAVLSGLHSLLGDVRQIMSVLAAVTQALVAGSVLAGLVILIRLFARQLAMLRALGAPDRFVLCVVWCYATTLLTLGTMGGLAVAYFATTIISSVISERTQVLLQSSLGWMELHMAAVFLSTASIVALVPALMALNRPVVTDLR